MSSPAGSPATPASSPSGARPPAPAPEAAPDDRPGAGGLTPELRALLRRVKLGKTLDTLPERLALARSSELGHGEFLELILADEVARRDTTSAASWACTTTGWRRAARPIWSCSTPRGCTRRSSAWRHGTSC